jgi:RNA recognition motif-containing protein
LNLYVGNLPFSTTEDELKEIFSEYGTINSLKIITDRETGKSRGFGFVDISDNSGRKAISELNGAEYDNKVLTVNEARDKKEGFGGNTRSSSPRNGNSTNRYSRSW